MIPEVTTPIPPEQLQPHSRPRLGLPQGHLVSAAQIRAANPGSLLQPARGSLLSPGFYGCLGTQGKLRVPDRDGLKDPVWNSLTRQDPGAPREARHSLQLSACLDTKIASPRPQSRHWRQGSGEREWGPTHWDEPGAAPRAGSSPSCAPAAAPAASARPAQPAPCPRDPPRHRAPSHKLRELRESPWAPGDFSLRGDAGQGVAGSPTPPRELPGASEENFASGMGVWRRSFRCRAQSWGWSFLIPAESSPGSCSIPGCKSFLPPAPSHLLDEVEAPVHRGVHLPASGQPCGDRPQAGSPSLSPLRCHSGAPLPREHPLEKGRMVRARIEG